MWVNAEYDALLLGGSVQAAGHESEALSQQYGLAVGKRLPSVLSGLSAEDVTLERDANIEPVKYIHLLVAYRAVPHEVGIIYTIGLRQKARSAEAEALFAALIRSFKAVELSD